MRECNACRSRLTSFLSHLALDFLPNSAAFFLTNLENSNSLREQEGLKQGCAGGGCMVVPLMITGGR